MCQICKTLTGKTPEEALAMLDDLGLPEGQREHTRVRRLARGEENGHFPHYKNIKSTLNRMLEAGIEKVDFAARAPEEKGK